jgi:hypothetical protein
MPTVDTIWYTRGPVPNATGLAFKLGWLGKEFERDGVAVKTLQKVGGDLARHHYDHELPTLIRERGNLFAIPANAQGAPTRLIRLTWIDEGRAQRGGWSVRRSLDSIRGSGTSHMSATAT